MAQQKARTGGHGYTFLTWRGNLIANVQQIAHTSPQPIAQPAVIQPINHVRPLEIAPPAAIGHGMLTVQIIEFWEQSIWDKFSLIANSTDLADIFGAVAKTPDEIVVAQVIMSPDRSQKKFIYYHGCKIADLRDGETVDITTIQLNKEIDIWYTYAVRDGHVRSVSSAQPSGVAGADDLTGPTSIGTE